MSSSRRFDATDVPKEFQALIISSFHVEFLLGEPVVATGNSQLDVERAGKYKNHCIIRVTFAQPTSTGFKGAHISMDAAPDDTGSNEAVYSGSNASDNAMIDGKMWVKIVTFDDQSISAIQAFSFPLGANNISLGQMVDVAISNDMHLFEFAVIRGIAYMGCRDFITQYFHQLNAAGFVRQTSTHVSARRFNEIICWRYSPAGGFHGASDILDGDGLQAVRRTLLPIDKGKFRVYRRVITGDMRYDQPVKVIASLSDHGIGSDSSEL